jgi:hypothetical protein
MDHLPVEKRREVLRDALPWSVFLPEPDIDEMLAELATVAQGAASLENLSPLALALTQWRHTAEVYADPALLAMVTREPDGDLGLVPRPGGDR